MGEQPRIGIWVRDSRFGSYCPRDALDRGENTGCGGEAAAKAEKRIVWNTNIKRSQAETV